MRVLRLIAGLDPRSGGPAVSSVASACAAQGAGVTTTMAVPVEDEGSVTPGIVTLRRHGVEVRVFGVCSVWHSKCAGYGISSRLTRWLKAAIASFDLVHVHGAWTYTTLRGLQIAKAARRPAVLTPHETLTHFDIMKSPLPIRLIKRALRVLYLNAFDLVIFTSELEALDSRIRPMRSRLAVIPHPLLATEPSRRIADRNKDGLRLGYLGRLDPKKNFDLLLDALADLPVSVSLTVAGDGALSPRYRARARELELSERIEWLGFIDAPAKASFFQSIDLLVVPSEYECFGMAAAEALGAGVPVLVSSRTGIAEIVRAHRCGYVIPPSTLALRDAVESILSDPGVLRIYAERAVDAARRDLSLTSHGQALRFEYERLVTRK